MAALIEVIARDAQGLPVTLFKAPYVSAGRITPEIALRITQALLSGETMDIILTTGNGEVKMMFFIENFCITSKTVKKNADIHD